MLSLEPRLVSKRGEYTSLLCPPLQISHQAYQTIIAWDLALIPSILTKPPVSNFRARK